MPLKNESLKISDLVEVPDIRTVIQLEDLKIPDLRRMIVDTFVLTQEVVDNLQAILTSLIGDEGRGIFLKGHFGSGKSHFLSMLSLLIKHRSSWDIVLSQAPSLADFQKKFENLRFLSIEISLVQHRGSEFLEDIVLRSIFGELEDDTVNEFGGTKTRHETFSRLKDILKNKGFSGMVLLIDELSEFLRSKSDARAYNEDIRFLQYLGEEASTFPFWVVASLQEWIEETGEIHQDTFNKIKDRYRIRLSLGRAHIEELVSERLIRHKQGAEDSIGEVFDELKSYFPSFPVTKERFIRLYPVHPATSSLLNRLKPLFSEHRGVVDFIHFRLKGDTERHIPSLLDKPAHQLLTPEVIFDHFLDRIRERSETQVYVQRVFETSQDEIPDLFKDPDRKRIALVVIKLLILFAISPSKYKYSVRHLAEMILFEITPMETGINYQFLYDILDRLAKEGSYVRVETHKDPFKNHYYIDLKADIAGIMRRRIRHMASEIFSEDLRLFWKIAAMVDSSYLPLGGWVEAGRQKVSLTWQHTRRYGTLLLRKLDELTTNELEGLSRQWERSEEDFFLLVGTTYDRDEQYRHVKDELLPRIRRHQPGVFLFWIPGAFEEDINWMKEILAAMLIREKIGRESREKTSQIHDFINMFIDKQKDRLTGHFLKCYYHGSLLWNENRVDLSRFGYLSQEKFLAEFIPPLLERSFPKHSRVQPYMDALPPGILKDMLNDFLSSGVLLVEDRSKFGIRDVLDGLLKPMSLIKNKGNQYELRVNPKQNELVRYFFDQTVQRETVPIEEIYWTFRKGEYGLLMPNFELLVLAMLFSGHLVAYKGMKRKGLDELGRSGLKRVTSLGKGEIISDQVLQAVAQNSLIPKKFRDMPVTLASQEELWDDIKSKKAMALEDLETLKSRIEWASPFGAFKNIPFKEILNDISGLKSLWNEVKTSLTSKEGLERFINAALREPFLEKKLKAIEECQGFLVHAERALFIYQYLTDQRLHIPEKTSYALESYASENGIKENYIRQGYEDLGQVRAGILKYYHETPASIAPHTLEEILERFQVFQESYIKIYIDSHQKTRGGDQFEPYEKLTRSKRYDILRRLDKLEMISVQHNRRTIDQSISSVLLNRCVQSPQDYLQGRPVCSCGFQLGESIRFVPVKDIEKDIDLGIEETLDALKSPAVQEKIIPFLEGLDLVGKKNEAENIRLLLEISCHDKAFLDRLDQILTAQTIQNINEAFRGKVVVVKRDLDRLYQSLVHRKYTLAKTRKILDNWLKQETISNDTFLHFLGKEEDDPAGWTKEKFKGLLEKRFSHLVLLQNEVGYNQLIKAMITTYWADQYDIPVQTILEIFPFLERGAQTENERWKFHLTELARSIHTEEPGLFESLVSEVEENASFIRQLWSALSSFSPAEIFGRESIFHLVVKEAFERLLSGKPEKWRLEELVRPTDHELGKNLFFREQKNEMIKALKTYALFKEKNSALSSPKDSEPNTYSDWEIQYIKSISPALSLCGELYGQLQRIGTRVPPFIKREKKDVLNRLNEITDNFRKFYRTALPLWEKEETRRPIMIRDIPSILSKKRNVPDHRQVYYVLMDGMRWDLWERIKSDFFGKRPNLFRFVRDGAFWANQPTNTASQLTCFEQAFRTKHSDLVYEDLLLKVSGIDEKVHTEKGTLPHLFANVVSYLEIDLLFQLKKLPSRTLLILFSDHGFVENSAFNPQDKYESPRYIHGKDSPFEVIIPWAWVMRL
ncbi:MAG TPA: hypothetical protein DDW42_05820 [Desulfobacteraceae bacterium]|nr:hypothetical protein [Desulfobacteraceae bacterium]